VSLDPHLTPFVFNTIENGPKSLSGRPETLFFATSTSPHVDDVSPIRADPAQNRACLILIFPLRR
jgi:hypothetical protein